MQKNSDFGLNFTGSNDVKNLTTSQSPPPSQFWSLSLVGLGHSPQDACLTVSPDLHVTKTEKSMCKLIHYTMLIIKEVKIATIGTIGIPSIHTLEWTK